VRWMRVLREGFWSIVPVIPSVPGADLVGYLYIKYFIMYISFVLFNRLSLVGLSTFPYLWQPLYQILISRQSVYCSLNDNILITITIYGYHMTNFHLLQKHTNLMYWNAWYWNSGSFNKGLQCTVTVTLITNVAGIRHPSKDGIKML
jgi:hypothetical protein